MSDESLKEVLERRASVIQRALRTGSIGDQKLEQLLIKPRWRYDVYVAIRRAATPKHRSRGGFGVEMETCKAEPFAEVGDEPAALWTPRRFLSQYVIAAYLEDDELTFEDRILQVYDAFGIELLAGAHLRGRSASESMLESFRTTGIDVSRIGLSCVQELYKILGTAAERGRRTILLRLVGDVDGILDLLAEAAVATSGLQWLAALRRLVSPYRASERTREPLDWLYDFDLLRQIDEAANRANQVGGRDRSKDDDVPVNSPHSLPVKPVLEAYRRRVEASTGAPMTYEEAAETLVQNQRRIVADASQILDHSKLRSQGDLFRASIVEELWWRSFGANWSAMNVATFCLGEERATWLTSGKLDPALRVKSTPVRARSSREATAVIFGAGVAGLTAAHELAERGIKVVVVDSAMPHPELQLQGMKSNVGGMARTQWTRPSDWPRLVASGYRPTKRYPGEHGYRLFPSFYRHVFDTMKRTPILGVTLELRQRDAQLMSVQVSPEQLGIRPTAFDQLQPTHQQVFARRGQYVPLRRERTRSLESFRTEYMSLHEGLGFPKRDMARFFFKLLRYLMTCSERRNAEYETKSLLEFFDPSLYSDGFIKAIKSAPQALVAMDAERCDARTQGNVYIQLLLDQILGSEYTDSTLRGPTSVAWFAHWYRYLESLNVKFANAELLSLRPFQAPAHTGLLEVVFKTAPDTQDVELANTIKRASYIVVALDAVSAERVTRSWDSAGVPIELRGYASHVTETLRSHLARYDVVITFKRPLMRDDAEGVMHRLLDRISVTKDDRTRRPRERSAFRNLYRATGQVPIPPGAVDEIRIILWFEHSAGLGELRAIERVLARMLRYDGEVRLLSEQPTWVNTPTTITTPRMPNEVFGEQATDRFQTFIGVQYYFAHDFKLVRGHVYLPDTDWGLSAVSQGQFWPRGSVPDSESVRGILSIDVGNCRKKSSYNHKTVMESNRDEIAREVWRQFTDSLRSTRGPTSFVTNLPLPEPRSYHVDDNLLFTCDDGPLRANRTPFLVNNVGDWDRRPRCQPWVPERQIVVDAPRTDATDVWQAPHGGYRVHARKVVFCGTYMRTFTRMTTMEAANESARHAVNAILDHMAAHRKEHDRHPIAGDYCDIWDPEEHELEDLDFFKRIDKQLFEAGKPHIADILQFDKIADLQYPDPSPFQALIAALGSTIKSDWGVTSTELVTSLDGLLRSAKEVVGGVAGATVGEHPLLKLLASLGLGKIKPTQKGS